MMLQTQNKTGETAKEWKIVNLREIGEIVTGTTPSTTIDTYWGEGYPFVTPTDFVENKHVLRTERTVTKLGAEKGRIIPKNSVMVVCIASVGEVAMASIDCITNQQINSIVCKSGINPHFLYYAMLFNRPILKRWAGITTSPIIKKSFFEKFPISLPSLPEQDKIAEILSVVDSAIELTDRKLEKTVRIKKSVLQKLMTLVAKNNTGKKLIDIFNIETGTTPSTKHPVYWANGSVNWLTPSDLSKLTYHMYVGESERKITPKAVKDANLIVMPPEAIIISTRAPVGYVAVLKEESAFNQGCKGLIPKQYNTIIPSFYAYYLICQKKTLNNMSSGSTFKELTKDTLANLTIPFPSISEQKKFVEILQSYDAKIDNEMSQKSRLEKLKRQLMSDLLTGRKRVAIKPQMNTGAHR